ncbi:hypothetical protein F4778DRAFT_774114 [Xylariomycetidae sp. FL2044]|nr:hypothetical protein F4778DRAFT_774114 [Xylariomycetidae sp. FL2044]
MHEQQGSDNTGNGKPSGSGNGSGSGKGAENGDHGHQGTSAPGPKPSIIARLGLDAPTLMLMLKGGIAPTIAVAICQSHVVADYFTTLGYLVGIICVISTSVLPRGKYVQTLILNLLFAGLGSAVSLLVLWSALQARLHTQSSPQVPGSQVPPYNSSQAAVSALWLFANIWFANTLRAMHPSLNVPVIIYSIFTNIACTYSLLMTSNTAIKTFVQQLLTAMLSAFAIATLCSLLILPVPSRKVTFGQMKGAIMLLRGAVKQEKIYLQSLEREDMFAVPADIGAGVGVKNGSTGKKKEKHKAESPSQHNTTAEAQAVRETMFKVRQLIGKIYADLPFAKRDLAWDYLTSSDLSHLLDCLRAIIIPVVGISTVIDIFQRIAEKRGWITTEETPEAVVAEKNEEKRVWNEVMKQLHEPFEKLSEAIDQGLEHAGMLLDILPKPKSMRKGKASTTSTAENDVDVESKGGIIKPGDPHFADFLALQIKAFCRVRNEILRTWAKERGLLTDDASIDEVNSVPFPHQNEKHRRDQVQLYILLYIETLMQSAGAAVLDFVHFADKKVADGTMSKRRLILPKPRILRKWMLSVFAEDDKSEDNNLDLFDSGLTIVYMGDSFAQKKDPEHLPATNIWQRLGNGVRIMSKFISSEQSLFGFRVACATLTIGIVAFLENTHIFFQEQRLVWAMIIISIGMTQTSGQSVFGFVCRVLGTVLAMVFSLISWYIVDEKTPGVIVFLFLFLVFDHYFLLKYPQFIPAILITMVTHVMIIGYELQVRQIGVQRAEATLQPVYPIYLLAPYRLACVAGGCLVAFIWTIFPWPVTERTWLRRDLSATMCLLANYFSVINEILKSRLRGTGGDPTIKGTPAHHLAKHRYRLFGKLTLLLPSLKLHADFQRWEPTIGGRFPREIYEDIIRRSMRINAYLTLIAYTIAGPGGPAMTVSNGPKNSNTSREWVDALAVILADISPTQHSIICILTLLSNALQSGHSLPPHLDLPKPYELTRQLEDIDSKRGGESTNGKKFRGLLDARNMAQTGYAEFAVLQVCSSLVCDDLEGLVKCVSQLVGVVDFSYRVRDSSSSLGSSEEDGDTTDRVGTGSVWSPGEEEGSKSERGTVREEAERGKGKVD